VAFAVAPGGGRGTDRILVLPTVRPEPAASKPPRRIGHIFGRTGPRPYNAGTAWQEAVDVFALHHPSWPRPLAEREAARTAGAMLILDGREMPGETP
jgi:hypothetical protein